ncbi:hypothetical protein FB567DRAFT_211291 [Paraphoma chrysanthemicola]|uniref:Indole-diterpene biosynthesis protein PaxU n=1 Tax=Paraphoma chrysanthemicola TaxID=798071 RepID=A0A8K0QVB2_9PLEO|nr:hypothetical protein FB567DRAFT_211291 [Paraphoma chrysanthemicola]
MSRFSTAEDPIPHFAHLAPSIWEYSPASVYKSFCTKNTGAPSLVLLCTWTGAQGRYIAKYAAEYQRLFPSSRIMVIRTTTKDLCFRNSQRKQQRLKPAIEHISSLEYLNASGNDAGILMHAFSEGGSNKACELAEAYHVITGKRLPVSALCFDSTPGHPRYRRLCNALNKSLPPIPIIKHTGLLFGSVALGAIWITYKVVKGKENNVITRTRQRLLDPKHFDLTAPRCYLYSKDDALIAWQDVQEHADISKDMGVPVTDVLFEGSGHVGHARQYPGRYWNAVKGTWRSAGMQDEKHDSAIIVEECSDTESDSTKEQKRWSDADSQRTLLSSDEDGSMLRRFSSCRLQFGRVCLGSLMG